MFSLKELYEQVRILKLKSGINCSESQNVVKIFCKYNDYKMTS